MLERPFHKRVVLYGRICLEARRRHFHRRRDDDALIQLECGRNGSESGDRRKIVVE